MSRSRAALLATAYVALGAAAFAGLRAYEPVRVSGGSMYPALRDGDVVFVSSRRKPVAGDIALLHAPGHGPVLHRVVERQEDGTLLTKGDANRLPDFAPTPETAVRGTVVRVLPAGALLERVRD